jgi:hypothetical protein
VKFKYGAVRSPSAWGIEARDGRPNPPTRQMSGGGFRVSGCLKSSRPVSNRQFYAAQVSNPQRWKEFEKNSPKIHGLHARQTKDSDSAGDIYFARFHQAEAKEVWGSSDPLLIGGRQSYPYTSCVHVVKSWAVGTLQETLGT